MAGELPHPCGDRSWQDHHRNFISVCGECHDCQTAGIGQTQAAAAGVRGLTSGKHGSLHMPNTSGSDCHDPQAAGAGQVQAAAGTWSGRLWLAARPRRLQEQREKILTGGSIMASQKVPLYPMGWQGAAQRLPCLMTSQVAPSGSAWLRKP